MNRAWRALLMMAVCVTAVTARERADAEERGARYGLPVFVPPLSLSTDNAARIGAAGLRKFRAGQAGPWDFNAEASLPL